jgi:hypothetical protein
MPEKIDKLIKIVYKKWKSKIIQLPKVHPDEEALACFLEGKLGPKETEAVKAHLISCDNCAQAIVTQIKLEDIERRDVPEELLARVKDLVTKSSAPDILEIILRLKEKVTEILKTTGDILVGQELVPAPVLRSRQIKDFKDEVTILKDFKDFRVEIKIENKKAQAFNLEVRIKEKKTQGIMKDLRVTLIKDDVELESYFSDSGRVTFEHVLLGKYTIQISQIDNKVASILLDIKV